LLVEEHDLGYAITVDGKMMYFGDADVDCCYATLELNLVQ
jgi:hypothetical protein